MKHEYKSANEIFESIYSHEKKVTGEINNLVDQCLKEKDYTTHNFLQWYVSEQIEEESLARTLIDKLNMIGNDKSGMYLLDKKCQQMSMGRGWCQKNKILEYIVMVA